MTRDTLYAKAIEIAKGRTGNMVYLLTYMEKKHTAQVLICVMLNDMYREETLQEFLYPFRACTLSIEEYCGVEELDGEFE